MNEFCPVCHHKCEHLVFLSKNLHGNTNFYCRFACWRHAILADIGKKMIFSSRLSHILDTDDPRKVMGTVKDRKSELGAERTRRTDGKTCKGSECPNDKTDPKAQGN